MTRFGNILRLLSGILLYASGNTFSASAQTDEEELHLNMDAVRMIQFDFSSISKPEAKPVEAPMEKQWMQFKTDIAMPRSLLDTTTVKKPGKFIRLLPFSIWTRFDEDPIYDVLVTGRPSGLEMTWSLGKTVYKEEYGKSIMPAPGETYQSLMTKGAGITIENLDINKFLTENFTRRGRMLRHNRKHANAPSTCRYRQRLIRQLHPLPRLKTHSDSASSTPRKRKQEDGTNISARSRRKIPSDGGSLRADTRSDKTFTTLRNRPDASKTCKTDRHA